MAKCERQKVPVKDDASVAAIGIYRKAPTTEYCPSTFTEP